MDVAEIVNPQLLGDLIVQQAERRPDRIALRFEGRETSFKALNEASNRVAHAFAAAGLKPGDRVAWIAQNVDAFWETFFAAAKTGIVLTPLNWRQLRLPQL